MQLATESTKRARITFDRPVAPSVLVEVSVDRVTWTPTDIPAGGDGQIRTVLLRGPSAPSSAALLVPAAAHLWARAANAPETDIVSVGRVTLF